MISPANPPAVQHDGCETALEEIVRQEAELLQHLRTLLLEQREAVAAANAARVEQTVYAAHSVLRQLEDVRAKRSVLQRAYCNGQLVPLGRLAAILDQRTSPELWHSLEHMLQAAQTLEREVAINKRIIERSLRAGERLLRGLFMPQDERALYGQPNEPRASALLNQQV